jgi:hypothetical protein
MKLFLMKLRLFFFHNDYVRAALWGIANGVFAIGVYLGLGALTHSVLFIPKAKVATVRHVLET